MKPAARYNGRLQKQRLNRNRHDIHSVIVTFHSRLANRLYWTALVRSRRMTGDKSPLYKAW